MGVDYNPSNSSEAMFDVVAKKGGEERVGVLLPLSRKFPQFNQNLGEFGLKCDQYKGLPFYPSLTLEKWRYIIMKSDFNTFTTMEIFQVTRNLEISKSSKVKKNLGQTILCRSVV